MTFSSTSLERPWRPRKLSSALRVALFDLRQELSPPIPIIMQWVTFGLQIAVYGVLISRLIGVVPDYLQFYALGYVVLIVFDVATVAGRRFVEHGHEGRLPYLLSLPIPRWELFLATAIQGGLWLALSVSVPLVATLALIGNLTVISVSAAICSLFLLGFGASGLMLALSFLSFRSADLYLAIVSGCSALLIRFSTVLYPFIFLPQGYAYASLFSPLTYGSDVLRLLLGVSVGSPIDPRYEVAVLVALVVGTLWLATFLLSHLVEGVKSG